MSTVKCQPTDAESATFKQSGVRKKRGLSRLEKFLHSELKKAASAKLPKHKLLSEVLSLAIAKGILAEGERLPAEADLTTMTPYSLGTVQKALATLVEQGLVRRRKALGTEVQSWRGRLEDPLHFRFGDFDGQWQPVYPHLLSRKPIELGPAIYELLGECTKPICLERKINIADQFNVHSLFYVDADRFPIFLDRTDAELEGVNLKKLMLSETPFRRITQRLRLVQPERRVAKHIKIKPGETALLLRATVYGEANRIIYVHDVTIPQSASDLWIEGKPSSLPHSGEFFKF